MLPYLDVAGFKRRSVMPPGDVGTVEQRRPGFIAAALSRAQSHVNTRLRKRYGLSLPFGAQPAQPIASGTGPIPVVTLVGTPLVGSIEVVLKCTTPGALGVSMVELSIDGGQTFGKPFATGASVALPGTGLSALFSALMPDGVTPALYGGDNVWHAATPVPEQILWWMTQIVTPEAYRARGVNPQDPQIAQVEEDRTTALAQLLEAANGDTGLLDLPANEDGPSAISTGGPGGYTEESPYVWIDIQRDDARGEDRARTGTGFVS